MLIWLKNNKLVFLLLLVLSYFVYTNYFNRQYLENSYQSLSYDSVESLPSMMKAGSAVNSRLLMPAGYEGVAADVPLEDRLLIQESNMSLLVSDVRQTGDRIVKYAEENGGFMVNSSYNRPDESAFGTITVRIPTEKLNAALSYFRDLSVKVTNENLQGTDVTEQYIDIEARLATLNKTKAKYEEILNSATRVQDILEVTQQLTYIQEQIDYLIGQQKALESNASLTKITVYLSTDELSLPYTPDNKFRADVIFKLAVRSLVTTFYGLGEKLIWVAVYSVIWVPVILIGLFLKRFFKK